MGFFENVISDSRLHLQANRFSAVAATSIPGNLPDLGMVEAALPAQIVEPPVESVGDGPRSELGVVASPTGSTAVTRDAPSYHAGKSTGANAGPIIEESPPMSRTGLAPDGPHRVAVSDVQPGQGPETSKQTPAGRTVTADQRVSTASGASRVQRGVRMSSATGGISGASSDLSPQEGPAPVSLKSAPTGLRPGGTRTLADAAPSRPRTRSLTPQIATMSGLPADTAAQDEPPVDAKSVSEVQSVAAHPVEARLVNGPRSYTPAAVAWSLPAHGGWTPPPGESPGSIARSPQVRIGQVNVIVEAATAPRPPSPPARAEDLSSRLFLRGL